MDNWHRLEAYILISKFAEHIDIYVSTQLLILQIPIRAQIWNNIIFDVCLSTQQMETMEY